MQLTQMINESLVSSKSTDNHLLQLIKFYPEEKGKMKKIPKCKIENKEANSALKLWQIKLMIRAGKIISALLKVLRPDIYSLRKLYLAINPINNIYWLHLALRNTQMFNKWKQTHLRFIVCTARENTVDKIKRSSPRQSDFQKHPFAPGTFVPKSSSRNDLSRIILPVVGFMGVFRLYIKRWIDKTVSWFPSYIYYFRKKHHVKLSEYKATVLNKCQKSGKSAI